MNPGPEPRPEPRRCVGCGATDREVLPSKEGANLCGRCFEDRAIRADRAVRSEAKGLNFEGAEAVAPRRVSWLWERRVPLGAISALVGPGGLGKSTLAAALTARITRGTLPGDLEGEPGNVFLASAEDTEAEVLVPRLMAAGADLSRVRFPKLRKDGSPAALTFPDDLDLLAAGVRAFGVRLVVLDPLVAYVAETYDTHRDHHVRRVLAPLAELAEDLGLAILPLVHVNKKDARNVLERVGGSVAFVNAPRSVLALGNDPDEGDGSEWRVLAHAKSNWGPKQPSLAVRVETETVADGIETSRAVLEGESRVTADELFISRTAEERDAAQEAREFLLAELADGPRLAEELKAAAEGADIAWRTCQRQRAKLGITSRRDAFGGKYTWTLPAAPGLARQPAPGGKGGALGVLDENGPRKPNIEPPPALARQPSPLGADGGPDAPLTTFEEEAKANRLMRVPLDDEELEW